MTIGNKEGHAGSSKTAEGENRLKSGGRKLQNCSQNIGKTSRSHFTRISSGKREGAERFPAESFKIAASRIQSGQNAMIGINKNLSFIGTEVTAVLCRTAGCILTVSNQLNGLTAIVRQIIKSMHLPCVCTFARGEVNEYFRIHRKHFLLPIKTTNKDRYLCATCNSWTSLYFRNGCHIQGGHSTVKRGKMGLLPLGALFYCSLVRLPRKKGESRFMRCSNMRWGKMALGTAMTMVRGLWLSAISIVQQVSSKFRSYPIDRHLLVWGREKYEVDFAVSTLQPSTNTWVIQTDLIPTAPLPILLEMCQLVSRLEAVQQTDNLFTIYYCFGTRNWSSNRNTSDYTSRQATTCDEIPIVCEETGPGVGGIRYQIKKHWRKRPYTTRCLTSILSQLSCIACERC